MEHVRILFVGWLACSTLGLAEVAPKGFEAPGILEKVVGGQVLAEDQVDISTAMRVVFRAFFSGVTPDRFVDAVTDHANYPNLFPEVQTGRTVSVNADKTQWDYAVDINAKIGFFTKKIHVEAHQQIVPAKDLVSEWTMTDAITNNREELKQALNSMRFIPYGNGFLFYSVYNVQLQNAGPFNGMAKKRLRDEALRQIRTFRKTLRADP